MKRDRIQDGNGALLGYVEQVRPNYWNAIKAAGGEVIHGFTNRQAAVDQLLPGLLLAVLPGEAPEDLLPVGGLGLRMEGTHANEAS